MNLRQLEIFTTVIAVGSFTEAAKILHMAQPAVSIAVRKLEDRLGSQLICRVDNLTPTAEGAVLLAHAKQLLSDMRVTKQAMVDLTELKTGLVRFSTSPILGSYFFPKKIKAFQDLHPNIRFQVIHQETINERQMLDEQRCDMAIVNMEDIPKGMEAIPLGQQEVVACISPDNPLATKTTLDLAMFLQQPLVLYTENHSLRQVVNQASASLNINLSIIVESDLTGMILKMIGQNIGIGLCLRAIADHEKELVILPFTKPLFLQLGFGWIKDRYLSAANRAFIDSLKEPMSIENT
ncbi:MAG: LysR family cyn operon transcriptional activator [Kiritimatiellia bacterium]|jgi:LysR family cyn operon transcriptional activator